MVGKIQLARKFLARDDAYFSRQRWKVLIFSGATWSENRLGGISIDGDESVFAITSSFNQFASDFSCKQECLQSSLGNSVQSS